MKKLIAIALALVMVMGLVACGGNGGGNDAATKVSVFWYDEADVYLSTVRAELNKALDAAGVAYDNQYAGKDQNKGALKEGCRFCFLQKNTTFL